MKIGFDISQTGNLKAGTGYLAYSLIHALAERDTQNSYLLYPTFGDFYLDPDWNRTVSFIDQPNWQQGLGHRNLEEARQFWQKPTPDYEDMLGNLDLIHSNNFYCPTGLQHARLIYTLYDLGFLVEPDATTEANRTGCFTGIFRASLYADQILAISNYTRQHFLSIFPQYPPEKISVIPLASRFSAQGFEATRKPPETPSIQPNQFWLNVGTLEPRKNQIRLLNAYARLKAKMGKTYPLVFAGGKGWLLENFSNTIEELGLEADVTLLGYVGDNQLAWLYQNCYAFIYPSIFEGFGLPVLEAMSLGAAVITSGTTSLPEVVGEAGLLVNPYHEGEIMAAMQRLQTDARLHKQLKLMAIERSKNFSWQMTAKAVLEIYEKICAGG